MRLPLPLLRQALQAGRRSQQAGNTVMARRAASSSSSRQPQHPPQPAARSSVRPAGSPPPAPTTPQPPQPPQPQTPGSPPKFAKKSKPARIPAPATAPASRGPANAPATARQTRTVTAYCTADSYDLPAATQILRANGYTPDPFRTGLGGRGQFVHLRVPVNDASEDADIFIFHSGNIVGWAVPEENISTLAKTLLPAARNPAVLEGLEGDEGVESEDLEFVEVPGERRSYVRGDVIYLGVGDQAHVQSVHDEPNIPLLLSKLAFSSGLSRSTKLAHLETLLTSYLQSVSPIPSLLSKGSRLPYTSSYLLRKTGQLLSYRAQLNLTSELTDSLPDLFWDTKHELGLEACYEGVARALDVNNRIEVLNGKLGYAKEIVDVVRDRKRDLQSLGLEWMIIGLITVEVMFEVWRMWKEKVKKDKEMVEGDGEIEMHVVEKRREREENERLRRELGELMGRHAELLGVLEERVMRDVERERAAKREVKIAASEEVPGFSI
ncbi:YagE family protein [Peziza echinospora]|nr:YagE family protein [Peziza echinospora]